MSYLKKAEVFAALDEWNKNDQPVPVEVTLGFLAGTRLTKGHTKRTRLRMERLLDEWIAVNPDFVERKHTKVIQEPAIEAVGDDHDEEINDAPLINGTMEAPDQRRQHGQAKTYVFTCAQNNTNLIPDAWWDTLHQLVDYYDAELHISQFTYNKAAYGKNSVKPGSKKATDDQDMFYDARIADYVSDEDIQITDDLVWLGSLNMSPTLVNPISGFQTHTREASAIIPHNKMAMESVATMKNDPARFVYTTGAVTQRNYIQKTAGQKADFHHVFGALLVEVADDGSWFARQLNFDKDGGLYDLDKFFHPEGVHEQVRVQAVTHGDIHGHKMDEAVCDTVFGPAGMLDHLMPREQFFHDILDFMPRNHHNLKQFQFMHEMHADGMSSVKAEFDKMGFWLMHDAHRDWCRSFVVVSNHDQAFEVWLNNRAAIDDPINLEYWLEWNLRRARDHKLHPFKSALMCSCYDAVSITAPSRKKPVFLLEDDSYRILGKIEAALHGHKGPNGSRGSPKGLGRVGKANTGHTHTCGIYEGVYTAGVLGKMDMGYNVGPSSWSHSSIVTYANGKRAILTHSKGKWWR